MQKSQSEQVDSIKNIMKAGSSGFVMPFGKHKGKDLSDIPLFYVRWLILNVFDDDVLVEECEKEIERRN